MKDFYGQLTLGNTKLKIKVLYSLQYFSAHLMSVNMKKRIPGWEDGSVSELWLSKPHKLSLDSITCVRAGPICAGKRGPSTHQMGGRDRGATDTPMPLTKAYTVPW